MNIYAKPLYRKSRTRGAAFPIMPYDYNLKSVSALPVLQIKDAAQLVDRQLVFIGGHENVRGQNEDLKKGCFVLLHCSVPPFFYA